MEDKDLIALISKKNGPTLDKTDPIFLVATMFEAFTKEAMASLAKIVTDAADQQATASVLAENTARVRGQAMVTDGAKYGADQIKTAGDAAARSVIAAASGIMDEMKASHQATREMWRFSVGAAAVCLLSAIAIISWQVWGPA